MYIVHLWEDKEKESIYLEVSKNELKLISRHKKSKQEICLLFAYI